MTIKPDLTQPIPDDLGTVHFVGIGGAGLSAIARIMAMSGVEVTGSDDAETPFLPSLRELGVTSAEVLGAVLRRSALPDVGSGRLRQFVPVGGHWLPEDHVVAAHDRPPIREFSARR